MKILVDNKMTKEMRDALFCHGITCISLPSYSRLHTPVSAHPDILLYRLGSGEVVIGEDYYNENRAFFDRLGFEYVTSNETPHGDYPNDVIFDVLGVGDTLYGKEGCVSLVIKKEYPRFVSVKQGYVRCSVAMLSDSCAVTADKGISEALKKDGIDVLDIRPGRIKLEGHDTGFIGGAGGRLKDREYLFFGDILSHPDGKSILEFAEKNGIKAVSLTGLPLSDHGGFVVI